MRGLGTIINALAIVIGGVLGILFKRFLKERYQDTIIKATGFSVVFLGAAGTLSKILTVRPDGTLSTGGSMVMILSLALGALLGELIDLDAQFERFGEWLKHKTGSDGDNQFVNGFVSASLTVSIGAMAVIGSIQDGIYGTIPRWWQKRFWTLSLCSSWRPPWAKAACFHLFRWQCCKVP